MSYKERTRTIHISSETVDYYSSSDTTTVNYSKSITPLDDYDLVYAVRSVGLNSSAFNISEIQKNNKLTITIEYDDSETTAYISCPPIPANGEYPQRNTEYEIYEFTTYPNLKNTLVYHGSIDVDIIVPDGLYTFSQLLDQLSTSNSSIGNYIIPSGYVMDGRRRDVDVDNMRGIQLRWLETTYGFIIEYVPDSTELINLYTTPTIGGGATPFTVPELYPKIKSITIKPNSRDPLLYNLLFTNYNSSSQNTPISTPSVDPAKGINPPTSIQFLFDGTRPVTKDPESDTFIESTPLNIIPYLKEIGNETNYDIGNEKYPTKDQFNYRKYVAYSKPILHPSYVDIEINLPNDTMDEQGEKSILSRIFTLGANTGTNSLFRAWENPKETVLSGYQGFSTIQIKFSSQNNLWNFFNLEFNIELEVWEVKRENETNDQLINFNLPKDDQISEATRNAGLSGTPPIHPGYFTHQPRGIQIQKKRSRFV